MMIENDLYCLSELSSLKGITCLHWNCHSLFPKLEEIFHILKNASAEINIFTESWTNSAIPTGMLEVEGYNIFRQDRHGTKKKRGGGIVVYTKTHKNIKQVTGKSLCNDDIEVLVLQMSLVNVREIYLLCTYRPPDGSIPNFINHLEDIMMTLSDKAVIEINIIGDININLSKRDPNTERYKDLMKRHSLTNLIKGDTYHHYNGTSSPVDHYLTNNPDLYMVSGICPFSESDHDVIFAARKKDKIKSEKSWILARKYKDLDNNALKRDVENHNWDNVLKNRDVNSAWDNFVFEFNSILDTHAPWKWMCFEDNLPVWATRELLSCCKQRDALEKQAKKSGLLSDRCKYTRARNSVTNFKKVLKRDHFQMAFEDAGSDLKKLGRVIRQVLGSGQKKSKITEINGHTDSTDILLSSFWTSVSFMGLKLNFS